MAMIGTEFAEVAGGVFRMGADDGPHPEDGEGPKRPVALSAYSIATTAVSNAEFGLFINATGYATTAERVGFSQVFKGQLAEPDRHCSGAPLTPWWRVVEGACWRRPNGTNEASPDLPVVHVSRADALAFCDWAGLRLPTEAEWEYAAGGQRDIEPNIWAGDFPDNPLRAPGPAPVADARPNEFGLRHACGNVWEWTADRFARLHSPRMIIDPKGPLNGDRYVVKGGSFLCAPTYCARYRPSSRRAEIGDASASNLGFRVAR